MADLVESLGVETNWNICNGDIFDLRALIWLRKGAVFVLNAADLVDIKQNVLLNGLLLFNHVFL